MVWSDSFCKIDSSPLFGIQRPSGASLYVSSCHEGKESVGGGGTAPETEEHDFHFPSLHNNCSHGYTSIKWVRKWSSIADIKEKKEKELLIAWDVSNRKVTPRLGLDVRPSLLEVWAGCYGNTGGGSGRCAGHEGRDTSVYSWLFSSSQETEAIWSLLSFHIQHNIIFWLILLLPFYIRQLGKWNIF